jgi:peptide/nickel transport system substrate-binding protein
MNLVIVLLALLPTAYNEAPMLQALVKAGTLPPIEQRLPDDPMVVAPYENIGVYGGQMRVITGQAQQLNETQYMLYTPLLRFAADGKTIVPNLAKRWEMSEDGKVCTITLRRGLKWSDGHPATTEDVKFAWEDVFLNKEITPILPSAYRLDGKPMKLEIINDHTFRMIFDKPYGSLPYFLTRSMQMESLLQPKHYLKYYLPRYTPKKKLEQMAHAKGFDLWWELFKDINHTQNPPSDKVPPDYPTLGPWQVAETPATGHVILRRNPYFWQVDPKGNQLPYIDEIYSEFVGNPEARNLKFVSGEIDFAGSFARFDNSPLFLSGRKRGNYRVFFWKENQGTRVAYYFNQTHEDPEKRKIFQDKRFRIALSHAINRAEINDIVYYGQCLPRQDTVNRVCSFFKPEFETAHIEYDPAKAQRMLDEIGLKRQGLGRWRKLPSGKTLVIILDAFPVEPYQKTAALIKEYWQAVGVLLNYRTVQGALGSIRVKGNKHDVVGYPNDCATEVMVISTPLYGISYWAPLWSRWLTAASDIPLEKRPGEPPPQHIEELYSIWSKLRGTADVQTRIKLGQQLIQSQADNLWGIGTVGESLGPIIVSNRLHNVAQWMLDSSGKQIVGERALWGWPWLATFLHHPEQWYIQE